jgi:Histidine kinase-like ATPase domain
MNCCVVTLNPLVVMAVNSANGNPLDLRGGGCCWRLPADRTCAPAARALLKPVLVTLGLSAELIDDVEVMVSELATNALVHGVTRTRGADGSALPVACAPELWAYTRVRPASQLVVKVYDPNPEWITPAPRKEDDLAEHGRGLGIVEALSIASGRHLTRSRLAPQPVSGKAAYFVVPAPVLPDRPAQPYVPASQAAKALCDQLALRGIGGLRLGHAEDRSLVSLPCGLTVWSEHPGVYRWRDVTGGYQRRPYLDLIDVTELAVQRHEETAAGHNRVAHQPPPPERPL